MTTTSRIITESDAWAHPELGFTEPEVVPDHGYWRALKPSGFETPGTISKSFRTHERAGVLATLKGVSDVYVTQNYFTQQRCTKDHVYCIPGAWVDLDIYRIPGLMEQSRPDLIRQLLAHCDDNEVPRPSYTIASGRGLYLKWRFTHPAEATDKPRCDALNKALAQVFTSLGADTSAKDAARILRPVGSVNSKSGAVVHVAHREEDAVGAPIRHDMTALHAAACATAPPDPCDPKPGSAQTAGTARPATKRPQLAAVPPPRDADTTAERGWKSWNERVLEDITRLTNMRWPNGVPEGWRDLCAFHAAVQIAHIKSASQVMPALRDWAARRLPPAFIDGELEGYMQSVCDRAWCAQQGKTIEYQRHPSGPVVEMSPIYTYRRTTLLSRLAITPAESRQLDVLIHDDERRARERARKAKARRAQGCRTAAEHAAERAAEADRDGLKVEALRAQGRSWAKIAAALDISAGAARQRLNRLQERRADRGDATAQMAA